ncbi:MAG: nuclear transport factor 2 family protein [Solimonas sp.]
MAEPLAGLAARAAIADVVHGYAHGIRAGAHADCAALFCDDGVFEIRTLAGGTRGESTPRDRFEGRAAILDYLARGEAANAAVCPLIHNLVIEIDGDEATGHSVMTTLVWPAGKQIAGEYRDRFRREGGRWRIAERVFTLFGPFAG